MAAKLRVDYEDLETRADGVLDRRGRKGLADVPVHFQSVRLLIRIKTEMSERQLARLQELVDRYCPVHSLITAAVPDYEVTWERM
jgi:uncharacterized OsmC-like protein